MPLRRAGTVTNTAPYYGPGSAAHRKCAALRPGNETFQRTNSFIALSSPSIVIGYMRCENSRRMMVVDSE